MLLLIFEREFRFFLSPLRLLRVKRKCPKEGRELEGTNSRPAGRQANSERRLTESLSKGPFSAQPYHQI